MCVFGVLARCVCVIRMSARCVCDLCVRALCVCQRAAQSVSVFAARWVSYSKKRCFSNALRHTLVVLEMH